MNIYTIFDTVAGVADHPFTSQTDGVCKRAISDFSRNPNFFPAQHPEDFSLFRIGSFDPHTMVITPEVPQMIAPLRELCVPCAGAAVGAAPPQAAERPTDQIEDTAGSQTDE